MGDVEMYEMLFQRHPDPLFVMDTSGVFLAANAAFESLTGYRFEDLRELTYAPFVRDHDAAHIEEHFVAAVGGEVRRYEAAGVDRHGRPFDVHVTNVPVTDRDGVVAVLPVTCLRSTLLARHWKSPSNGSVACSRALVPVLRSRI